MIRRRSRSTEPQRPRPSRHGRHGRLDRSSVVRPPLPALETRHDRFDLTVRTAADFLRSAWPELQDVRFEIAGMPPAAQPGGIPRWHTDTANKRIVLFRIPIERLGHLHREDDLHRRMYIESCVFRAAAQFLDRDPWDLGPDRFRPY